jgi:GMP synthase-like glutamine amidotransferase
MARLRVHWLQHVPFEGLGSIALWLEEHAAEVSMTAFWRGDEPPAAGSFDWLIIMGGPMSVHDEAEYPWLRDEKELIRQAIAQGKVVFGICLGAQLIAEVLGGEVTRNPEREIGWFPIERTSEASGHPMGAALPHQQRVFHWHGETFSLPSEATALARSAVCANQAFAVGDRVIALQFHLETTPQSARALLENCADDLKPGHHVQTAEQIAGTKEDFDHINAAMARLLSALPGAAR